MQSLFDNLRWTDHELKTGVSADLVGASVVRFSIYVIVVLAMLAGCSRTRYRVTADRDAYALLREKAGFPLWAPPSDFSLHPPPTSRLYDPTPLDDPWLPMPAPQLYAYELPELSSRTTTPRQPDLLPAEPIGPPPVMMDDMARSSDQFMSLAHRLPPTDEVYGPCAVQQAAFHQPDQRALQPPTIPTPEKDSSRRQQTAREAIQESQSYELQLVPITTDAWSAIPTSCLMRMFEFRKLRDEYRKSFGTEPGPEQYAPGKRLTLEDIVELALLNSREYQTQKETLYRVSLDLSLERFAYQLKFSPFNNGTAVNWNHTRSAGTTENGLSIPTTFQVDKMLATGGDLVARFANDVVLTFNGPQGFASDVGSDLFLELNQTVFQRDVRFESLTQAERDVVYAARDFVSFRKSLFVQLASQYYNLIRTYRQVEIDSQNYFTLVRAFHQSTFEYRAGGVAVPRFQLDQVEQNVLSGRSRLIATCNNLESALDNLKIRMGLPTETYVNIDLGELDRLTTRDELSVTGELIRRVRQRLLEERTAQSPNRLVLIRSSIALIDRILESQRLQRQLDLPVTQRDDLRGQRTELRMEAARENANLARSELNASLRQQPPSPIQVFLRTVDLIDALLAVIESQIELGEQRPTESELVDKLRKQYADFQRRTQELHSELDRLIEERRLDQLPQLLDTATRLQNEVEAAAKQFDMALGLQIEQPPPAVELQRSLEQADRLLQESDELLQALGAGLTPIEIDADDAMLTALNLRFDLMNQRGDVADSWRQIKYAGDDLKSVLNITASHRVSTRSDVNRVFDFTFNESDTRVQASFDAPFNRRAERNSYRQTLINYQAALRQLMLLEDNIKLAVRNDLRGLSLDKEQYRIEVASAALAYERVVSVLLYRQLNVAGIAVRDFLEAQNAYASALSNVASRHIGYIVDRTQLFLDLELLTVGDDGFWHELYDEQYQPTPYYQLPPYAQPVYGELVPGLWYSRYLRRLEQVSPGESAIYHQTAEPNANAAPPAELPAPLP